MIKIENVEVMGWEHTIRGIRNTMGSWNKSDSGIYKGGDDGIGCENCVNCDSCEHAYDHSWQLGKADHDLMMRLEDAGYRRMITVNLFFYFVFINLGWRTVYHNCHSFS